MKIICGSREIEIPFPSDDELKRLTGLRSIHEDARPKLFAIYQAGAAAVLAAQENTRGARMERMLLEVPDG